MADAYEPELGETVAINQASYTSYTSPAPVATAVTVKTPVAASGASASADTIITAIAKADFEIDYGTADGQAALKKRKQVKACKSSLVMFLMSACLVGLFVVFCLNKLASSNTQHQTNGLKITEEAAGQEVEQEAGVSTKMSNGNKNPQAFVADLPEFETNGQFIDLVGDTSGLTMTTFTNSKMEGSFVLKPNSEGDSNIALTFMIDGELKIYSFQREDMAKDNEVIQSIYTRKTADENRDDYYEFDSIQVDVQNTQEISNHFDLFFQSEMPLEIMGLSLKIAAHGYTGRMAKPIRMLHSLASHLIEFDVIRNRLPKTFEYNRQKLNDYFTKEETPNYGLNSEKASTKYSITQHITRWVGSIMADDDCPGSEDGCPSYCYTQGACALEEKCDNTCFGMCGYECSCWSWVCGDCGCHCLCENHDYFCSCEGTTSYGCWSFWGFGDDDCN